MQSPWGWYPISGAMETVYNPADLRGEVRDAADISVLSASLVPVLAERKVLCTITWGMISGSTDWSPADIQFGKRLASTVRQKHQLNAWRRVSSLPVSPFSRCECDIYLLR